MSKYNLSVRSDVVVVVDGVVIVKHFFLILWSLSIPYQLVIGILFNKTFSEKKMAYTSGFMFCDKGPSKNVNIFMSIQTVHFFRPLPLKVYRPIFFVSKIWVSSKTFIVQQQKLTLILSLFDM